MIFLVSLTGTRLDEKGSFQLTNYIRLLNTSSEGEATRFILKAASKEYSDVTWIVPPRLLEISVKEMIGYLENEGYTITIDKQKQEPKAELLPLFRATFIRGGKTFNVVFRVQNQEEAIPYLEQNFGTKPMMRNIEVQPETNSERYAGLGNGLIEDESFTDDEDEE